MHFEYRNRRLQRSIYTVPYTVYDIPTFGALNKFCPEALIPIVKGLYYQRAYTTNAILPILPIPFLTPSENVQTLSFKQAQFFILKTTVSFKIFIKFRDQDFFRF